MTRWTIILFLTTVLASTVAHGQKENDLTGFYQRKIPCHDCDFLKIKRDSTFEMLCNNGYSSQADNVTGTWTVNHKTLYLKFSSGTVYKYKIKKTVTARRQDSIRLTDKQVNALAFRKKYLYRSEPIIDWLR